jgi:hypothetical protein
LNQPIRFLHIPKTAGSTFDECLFILYLRDYLLGRRFTFAGKPVADARRYHRLKPPARRRLVICTGHAPRHTGLAAIDAMPTVTLLRDPIERVKSFCQHVSEGKSLAIHRGDAARAFDLDAFLASGRMQLANFQTRMLLGDEAYRLPLTTHSTLVESAVAMLETDLACFGLTEDFDRSLLLFRQVLGWDQMPVYRARNVRDTRALLNFEPHHLERIKALNEVDIAVYERARTEYYRRLAQLQPQLEQDLVLLRAALERPGPIFTAIDVARAAKKWLLDVRAYLMPGFR